MNNKTIFSKVLTVILLIFILSGCVRFQREGYATMFGMIIGVYPNECAKRDITHHANYFPNGETPQRTYIQAREYRCRIERVCVNKSKEENDKCKKDAGNYWGFDENNFYYKIVKKDDDESDAMCALNPSSCSPKFKPQENYSTNPYWDKESKAYIFKDHFATQVQQNNEQNH